MKFSIVVHVCTVQYTTKTKAAVVYTAIVMSFCALVIWSKLYGWKKVGM